MSRRHRRRLRALNALRAWCRAVDRIMHQQPEVRHIGFRLSLKPEAKRDVWRDA